MNPTTNSVGLAGAKPEPMPTPEVGQTIILSFSPWGGVHGIHGEMYYQGGTYIEVEVKSVKTAKVVLE